MAFGIKKPEPQPQQSNQSQFITSSPTASGSLDNMFGLSSGKPNSSTSSLGNIAINVNDILSKQNAEKQKQDAETKRIKKALQERSKGAGEVTAEMKADAAGTLANVQRQQAAQGIKGGGSARMLADISRAQNAQIASSLYGMKGKALGDEISYIFGEKALAQKPPKQQSDDGLLSSIFG